MSYSDYFHRYTIEARESNLSLKNELLGRGFFVLGIGQDENEPDYIVVRAAPPIQHESVATTPV